MKTEFRRSDGENKVVRLYVGGEFVCSVGEHGMKFIDWKNASGAMHACREELEKWLDPRARVVLLKDVASSDVEAVPESSRRIEARLLDLEERFARLCDAVSKYILTKEGIKQ